MVKRKAELSGFGSSAHGGRTSQPPQLIIARSVPVFTRGRTGIASEADTELEKGLIADSMKVRMRRSLTQLCDIV